MGWERDRVRMDQEEDGSKYVPIGQREKHVGETHMDNIIEGALAGRYDGAPKKYVKLYDDLIAAGVPYAFVAVFQSALYRGELHQHAMKYFEDNRP